MDAKPPSFVIRGRDDAASPRVTPDHERVRAELRLLELLDCSEEGVEVEVADDHLAMTWTAAKAR